MKDLIRKYGSYLVAAIVFVGLTAAYIFPTFEGKVLQQGDATQWKGMSHELKTYNETADTPANWTNSMFSGMPGYQITLKNPGNALTDVIWAVDRFFKGLTTFFTDSIFALLLGYFLGFFILMRAFGIGVWMSIVGSIAVSMSSYFFIIIPAGHETKAMTLGMMAPVVGGFYLIFRKKYGWGAALVMLYSSIGLMKHPQMSYYLFMLMGIFGIAEIYIHIKEKRIKDLFVSLAVFVVAVGIGVGTGYSNMKANSEYVKETVRGGQGLDLDYATAWSYGVDETLTLLVPNYMGGASGTSLGKDSKIYKAMIKEGVPASSAKNIASNLPTYWGEQPFTAGPVYVGAIVCFLFLLGCLIVKGPYKWALLAATIFSIMLSWGHNFMALTEFFYKYFPFYSKFRAVSSILIVAEITMPLLGFLGLKQLCETLSSKDEKSISRLKRSILASACATGGLCLILALFGGSLLSFTSSYDARTLGGMPQWFLMAFYEQRASMLTSDSWRSLIFIVLAAGLVYLYTCGKLKSGLFTAVLGVLVVADMWPVDKRYFGESDWVAKKDNERYFALRDYERPMLEDPDYFRVFNIAENTFNESRTSYYFHSLGGYHAAKLRRYQDLIDQHLSRGNMSVVNMLNTKYIIQAGEDGKPYPYLNPNRFGPAWFVDEVHVVDGPEAESDALNRLDLRSEAVTDSEFADFALAPTSDVTGSVEFVSYAPDRLEYKTSSTGEKTAVFSEIYYPNGWKAYIDGESVEHYRVDYLLRALNVPAGEHEIVFEFRPESLYCGFKVNAAFKALMYLIIIALIAVGVLRGLGKEPEFLRKLSGRI